MKNILIFMLCILLLFVTGCSKKTMQTEPHVQESVLATTSENIDKDETESVQGYWYETITPVSEKKTFDSWLFSSYLDQFPIDIYQLDQAYDTFNLLDGEDFVYPSLKELSTKMLSPGNGEEIRVSNSTTKSKNDLKIEVFPADDDNSYSIAECFENGWYSIYCLGRSSSWKAVNLSECMGITLDENEEGSTASFDAIIDKVGMPTSIYQIPVHEGDILFALIYEYDSYTIEIVASESPIYEELTDVFGVTYIAGNRWDAHKEFEYGTRDYTLIEP